MAATTRLAPSTLGSLKFFHGNQRKEEQARPSRDGDRLFHCNKVKPAHFISCSGEHLLCLPSAESQQESRAGGGHVCRCGKSRVTEREGPSWAEAEQTVDKHALAGRCAAWESQASLTAPLREVFAAREDAPRGTASGAPGAQALKISQELPPYPPPRPRAGRMQTIGTRGPHYMKGSFTQSQG